MTIPTPASRRLVQRLFEVLDFDRLGDIYCDEGGDEFWRVQREPARREGLVWATALAARLPRGGSSLYVGAAVAELAVLVTEVHDLDRSVRAISLNRAECEVIDAALARVGLSDRLRLECADAIDVEPGGVDHLCMVSVLDDPSQYPTVSGVGYGRIPPVLLDVARFEAERERILRLVDRLLLGLRTPAWITTTYEEVPWLLHCAGPRGLAFEADDEVIETAIVGDPIGFLRVSPAT